MALESLEAREAAAHAIDVVAEGTVVAVAALLAVHAIRARRARVRAHWARPALGAVALAVDRVTRALVLTLTRQVALCPVGPRRARLIAKCTLPASGTVAGTRHMVARATVLAFAHLTAVLAIAPIGTLDVALLTFPAGPAGAVSTERVAVGTVQAGTVVGAVFTPPPRGTQFGAGGSPVAGLTLADAGLDTLAVVTLLGTLRHAVRPVERAAREAHAAHVHRPPFVDNLSPVDFSDPNLVLGAARREGPAPGVGPLPVGLLLLNLYLDSVRLLLRADVGPGELDPACSHVATAEAAVIDADCLQVVPHHVLAFFVLEVRIFFRFWGKDEAVHHRHVALRCLCKIDHAESHGGGKGADD